LRTQFDYKILNTGTLSGLHARKLGYEWAASIAVFIAICIGSAQSKEGAVSGTLVSADKGALDSAHAVSEATSPPSGGVDSVPPAAVVESETSLGDVPGEMVVTARRRKEGLQSVPLAVTAFSSEDLESRNVEATTSLGQFTPNLQLDGAAALSGSSSNATAFIRGIGQNDFAIFSDPGVGVYVDDVYMGRSIGGVLDVVDLERVEVLRGPQGTLFGRNTIGGAVLLTSKRPTYNPEGYVEQTGGSYFRNDIRAMLNAPIIDRKLSLRMAVGKLNRDGYGERLRLDSAGKELGGGDALGDINRVAGKVQVLWDPTSKLSLLVSMDGTRAREKSAVSSLTAAPVGGVPAPTFRNMFNVLVAPGTGITSPSGSKTLDSSYINKDPFKTYATGLNESNLDVWGVSVTPTWLLSPSVSLKSITSYRDLRAEFARDGDNTPFTYRETIENIDQWQVSQELQISGDSFSDRLNWLGGLYFFQEGATENANAFLAQGLYDTLQKMPPLPLDSAGKPDGTKAPYRPFGGSNNPANAGADLMIDVYNHTLNRSAAGFFNATFKILDNLGINAGLRLTYDKKEYWLLHRRMTSGLYIVGPDFQGPKKAWTSYDPRVGLEYQARPNVLTYATWSSGFKAGGFNGRPLQNSSEVTEYGPERLYSYELGVKTDWFKRKLVVNVAGFYYDYRDIQMTVNQTPRLRVDNVGKARLTGFETEAQVQPIRGLRLNGAVGYLNAKFTELGQNLLPTQTLPVTADSKLMKAPKMTASGGAEYTFGLPKRCGSFGARVDYSYRTKVYNDVSNTESIAQKSFGLLGARLSWQSEKETWNLAAFGTNLTNEIYRVSGAASPSFGVAESSYGRPLELAARLTRRF
jgi:iron complex outermembrane receptor protein